MPTRLEVLLQRRKSAAAGLFQRHRTANASAGIEPAGRVAEIRLAWMEFQGVICGRLSQLIDDFARAARAVNRHSGTFFTIRKLPGNTLFALRYGKICDSAHLITISWPKLTGSSPWRSTPKPE